MKSYFRLCASLLIVALIAIVLFAAGFFSTRKQSTAKVPNQAAAEAPSQAVGTTSARLDEPLSTSARTEPDRKPLFSPTAPASRVLESEIPEATQERDRDAVAANSEENEEHGSAIPSSMKGLRNRALKGDDSKETALQTVAPSEVRNVRDRKPTEVRLKRAGSFDGDLRTLPFEKSVGREMPEHDDPYTVRSFIGTSPDESSQSNTRPSVSLPAVPAPTPLNVFEGLDRFGFGAGSPPDTNGDVGPNHYIQTVNTSIGIYNKTTGALISGLTFDTFMSQGNFGNLCDTENFGDPVVLYDTFEDRWIITDFAFVLDGSSNVVAPAFQCFAASKTGDPVAGGWNFYSIQLNDFLDDYPKFGIWPDGLYMSANLFTFGPSSNAGARVWAFNKAQMYAGAPSVQSFFFNVGGGDFTIIPSNARLQTGTPPAGTPNYFLSTWLFTNALTIYKFHVDWDRVSLTTFTGPDVPIAATSWPNAAVGNAAQPGTATLLDVLQIRAMVQNQYTNFGGVESLWAPHTVRRAAGGLAAPRWYQVNVTGGTVNLSLPQATTWDPDAANTINRFMPSLALDRAGNMALGYSTSFTGATDFPSIKYAGRLSTDPINTFSLTEQLFFAGTASQTGTTRWGDYSSMTLDPNGCTFWYTTEYANPADQTFDHRWLTKFGSFQFSPCTTIGNGALQGTVTTSPGGLPISGATIAFGARTTTTNGAGFYSFPAIPAGTYVTETASKPGFGSITTTNIVIAEAGTTVKDFALPAAPTSACLVDTTQPDFQLGVFSNLDVTASPGNVTLQGSPVDQSSTGGTTTGTGVSTTGWGGQTFTAGVSGTLVQADTIQLFCNGCTGTTPNLTVSVRNTSGGLPTGADLTTATIPGFSTGTNSFTVTFSPSISLTAGTVYALLVRPVANPSLGTGYFWIRSSPGTYANGQRVTTADSGGTWGTDSTRDFNFRTIMQQATFATSGNIASGVKDSNPTPPLFSRWNSLAWTATVPANTTLRFQIAGSNNISGPFNFIGPDGSAATFFTSSPANINNLVNGNRYLKYKAFFTTTDTAVTPTVSDVTVCFNEGPTAAPATISGRVTDTDGSPLAGVTMNLSGDVDRRAITDSSGNYRFSQMETNRFYTVTPSLTNYHFGPESRSFSLLANQTDAVFTATRDAGIGGNAIDSEGFFVRQHYLDFLSREPDESGFNFWINQILACGGDAGCRERRTINVSAAYFLSIEFQNTGVLVDGMYRASYGRRPMFAEFMPDTSTVARNVVVGDLGWSQTLDANKRAFADSWVQRAEFQAAYGGMTNEGYVDALMSHTGVAFSQDERSSLVDGLNNGTSTRADVLRAIAENDRFVAAKRNEAFVMMQYFGYLRRDPDAAGYQFWLNKLNQFGGNFEQAEMVKAFIVSGEYRQRFAH